MYDMWSWRFKLVGKWVCGDENLTNEAWKYGICKVENIIIYVMNSRGLGILY